MQSSSSVPSFLPSIKIQIEGEEPAPVCYAPRVGSVQLLAEQTDEQATLWEFTRQEQIQLLKDLGQLWGITAESILPQKPPKRRAKKKKAASTKALQQQIVVLERAAGWNFPRELAVVNKNWLSSLMDEEVVSFETKVLDMGVLSDLGIVDMQYKNLGVDKTTSVVLKFAKGLDSSRGGAVAANAYVKEINFFKQLAEQVPFKSPKCHAIYQDPTAPNEYFCIAMENMNQDWEVMSGLKGATIDEVKGILRLVAKLHASYWNHETLDEAWLQNPGGVSWYDGWADAFRAAPSTWDVFIDCLRATYKADPAKFFDADKVIVGKSLDELMRMCQDTAAMARFTKNVRATLDSRPSTLVHNDLRSDNIFQSKSKPGKEFTFIDFQMIQKGTPGMEMVQLLIAAFANMDDYAELDTMVAYYYRLMVAQSPSYIEDTFTLANLREDFRCCAIFFACGVVGVLTALLQELLAMPEHPLWPLTNVYWQRVARASTILDLPATFRKYSAKK